MIRSIFRTLVGAVLSITLITVFLTIICDVFYFNKDSDYIRLADLSFKFIAIDYFWSLFLGVYFFWVPCLIYSGILEWRRRNGKSFFLISFGLGACMGLCVGLLVIPPLAECSLSDFVEGGLHCLGVTLVVGLLVPMLLGNMRVTKNGNA